MCMYYIILSGRVLNFSLFISEIQDGLLKIEVKNCEIDNIREGESKTVAVSLLLGYSSFRIVEKSAKEKKRAAKRHARPAKTQISLGILQV